MYSKLMHEWLQQNINQYDNEDLTSQFNETFNEQKTIGAIKKYCCKYGIKRDANGHKLCNESRISRSNATCKHPVGSIQINAQNKKLIKVTNECGHYDDWMPYNQYVWECAGLEIPLDYQLRCIDGDSLNCELSNLVCIPKQWLGFLIPLWSKQELLNETLVIFCELKYALDDTKNGNIPKRAIWGKYSIKENKQ